MLIAAEIKQKIKTAVEKLYNIQLVDVHLEHPENETWGDYASNICMKLAKNLKQSPMQIAKDVCYEMQNSDNLLTIKDANVKMFDFITVAAPGFINLGLSNELLQKHLIYINVDSNNYGVSVEINRGKIVIVEFSQPNPNKPMHIGHARNNFLGSTICNILSFLGYDVIRTNYINDWGTHICKSMLMYKKYGNNSLPTKKPDHFVGDYYMMYEKEVAKNPDLEKEVGEMFRQLEEGEEATVALWQKIVNCAYKGWETTYNDQNVTFDTYMYQHDYKDTGKEIVKIATDKGIAYKDASGAIVANLEKYNIPNKVLLRADGTSIYSTQDLQLAKDSYDKYHFDRRLYVVDYRQSDYFKQIFKILEVLGFEWASRLHHVSYGTVDLPQGKMSSRKGLVVNGDDVFEKLLELEEAEVKLSSKKTKIDDQTIRRVALSAFRYGMLKINSFQDIVFDYDTVTKFEGNTGPYLMYTYARAMSVLTKGGYQVREPVVVEKLEVQEINILRSIYKFAEVVDKAGQDYAPSYICNFLFDLAQRFNTFYAQVPILVAKDAAGRGFRLFLVYKVASILKTGLNLLGIDVVDKM